MSHASEVEQRKRDTAGVFSRSADTYDSVGPRFFAHFGRRLVEHAQLSRGARVLDVATGRGAVLFPAAEAVGAEGRIFGTDLSENMVGQASADIAQRGITNAEVRLMDAEQLEFADETFDHVLCGFALAFFPQVERALSEFSRVLKSRGRVTVSTWASPDERWKWRGELLKKYLPVPSSGSSTITQPAFHTAERMEAIMDRAGVGDVRVIAEAPEFVFADEEAWWASSWSHGLRYDFERIEQHGGAEALRSFKDEAFEQLRAQKQPNGIPVILSVLFTLSTKT